MRPVDGVALACAGLILYGLVWRIAQAVLWLLNGHRS